MVRKLLLVVLSCLMLSGCAYFFSSPFPAFLPLVVEVADLSGKVGSQDWCEDCYRVFYLNGYVFVLNSWDDVHILDGDLNYIKKGQPGFPHERLGVYSPALPGYVFGDHYYMDDPPSFTHQAAGLPYMAHTPGYFDPAVGDVVTMDVNYDDLSGQNRLEIVVGGPAFYAYIPFEMWLADVAFDDSKQETYVFLRGDADRGEVLVASSPDIAAGGPLGTLGEYPFGYPLIRLPRSDYGRYHYTRDGFVSISGGNYKLCSLDNGEVLKSIVGSDTRRSAAAFDIDGDYFYVYDGEARKIYKCKTWWR
jgi:hypothetical protein